MKEFIVITGVALAILNAMFVVNGVLALNAPLFNSVLLGSIVVISSAFGIIFTALDITEKIK